MSKERAPVTRRDSSSPHSPVFLPSVLSRREAIALGAATGVLPLFPGRAAAQQAPPATTTPPPSAEVVASVDLSNHLTVPVQINGKGPFKFVVDTGADRTILATDVAQKLGLVTSKQVLVEGVVRTIPADTVEVASLTVGPVTRENMKVPILVRELLVVDGYLGLDAVDGYSVSFDFASNMLRVAESGRAIDADMIYANSVRVPARGSYGHLKAINCYVDGVPATAFIDSGAQVSIGNGVLLAALAENGPHRLEPFSIPVTGVTGGQADGKLAMISNIQLRNLQFQATHIVIADLQIFDIWGLSETPALLIGMNYLSKFSKVTIDYGVREFRFDLAEWSEGVRGFERA
jgi:predicted aspartyl protease